jgi:UDP-glucuronate decarboxylase
MTSAVVAEDVDRILAETLPWDDFSGATFLVTGATGMVGQYLVRTLLGLGRSKPPVRVIALTRRAARAERMFAGHSQDGALRILLQDVSSPIVLDERPDYVIHAASPANPASFEADPVGVIRANVAGTENVLSAAAESGATVCYLSSSEVYGKPLASSGDSPLLTESSIGALDPLALRSAYPQSKRMAENLCVAYGAQHGIDYRIARLSYTYGPGMDLEDSRVQAYFFRQALRGQDIILQSDGALTRMYTYVSDAISALFYLLAARESLACNIANEAAQVSIHDLAQLVLRQAGATKASVKFADGVRFGNRSPAPVLLDCARMRSLGWQARVDLETGIARTVRHHMLEQGCGAS